MKNIVKIPVLFAALLVLGGACKKYDYTYTYEGDNYVQFESPSGTFFVLDETGTSYDLPFQIIGEAPSSDITMQVEFLESAEMDGNLVRATILPGEKGIDVPSTTLTIPAGSYTGTLTVEGSYDALEFGEIDTLLVRLSDGSVKADQYNDLFILKIQKYYPYQQEEYPGFYSGTYFGIILDAEVPANPGLTIEAGEEDKILSITEGLYQEQIDDWAEIWTDGPYPIEIYMNDSDPANFTVEIPEVQYLGTTDDTWDYWIQPYPEPGSFNAATKELEIVFYVSVYGGDQPPQDIAVYTVTLSDALAAKISAAGNISIATKASNK